MQTRQKATLKFYETCKSRNCQFRAYSVRKRKFSSIFGAFSTFFGRLSAVSRCWIFGIELLYFKNCDIIREKVHKCEDYGRRPPTHLSLPICKTIDLIAKSKNSIIQNLNHFDNFQKAAG